MSLPCRLKRRAIAYTGGRKDREGLAAIGSWSGISINILPGEDRDERNHSQIKDSIPKSRFAGSGFRRVPETENGKIH
jgi:hypothetical protein